MDVRESREILPPDFVIFINKNYERIEDIQRKLEQFLPEDGKFHLGNYRKGNRFPSVDSCFSDGDTTEVISARIIPKRDRLNSLGRIKIGLDSLDSFQNLSLDADQDYSEIYHKFPLLYLSNADINEKEENENLSNSALQITGIQLSLAERIKLQKIGTSKKFRIQEEKNFPKSKTKKTPKRKKRKHKKFDPNVNESISRDLAVDNYKRFSKKKRRFSLPDFQLTLPPLHSSVLTLLGQKSQLKASPRNPISQDPTLSAGGTKHKKLRRHGRNRRKSECKNKNEANKNPNADEKEGQHRKSSQDNGDEPHETQMSTLTQNDDYDADARTDPSNLNNRKEKERQYTQMKAPLYKILDGKIISSKWNPQILSNLDEEIHSLHEDLKKYETKFKSSNIGMKEDLWLSFPRTWSRGSASFGIPNNPRSLKTMEPSEYLRKYVRISESRIHLYNLVFHRHRTIENPTLKDISFKAVMSGLSEVLGRNFTEKELNELAFHFMGLDSLDGKVDEFLFRGMCAFCERVYGSHSLEDCAECHKCSKGNTKDKSRCHLNQQSHLEKADFEYISTKIRNNEIQTNLSHLLRAVCEKKENGVNNIEH